jgi:hypothetical protein
VRSSKLDTTTTGAVMPPADVPTLPPRPSIASGLRRGDTSSADSAPRTQCGTITASPRTFSSPSARIFASVQSIACSSASEPLSRLPKVSVSSAMRFHAALSFVAASINRSAAARYGSGDCAATTTGSESSAVATSAAQRIGKRMRVGAEGEEGRASPKIAQEHATSRTFLSVAR